MREQREAGVGAVVLLTAPRRRLARGPVKIIYFFLPAVVVMQILAETVVGKNVLSVLMVELGLEAVDLEEQTAEEQIWVMELVVAVLMGKWRRSWG